MDGDETVGRRALCVGINQFKNYPQAALRGCVNDAYAMSSLLQEKFGFRIEDITLLTDADAFKANIMSHLESMVEDARRGRCNTLVFSFSSHGTRIPDLDGDEDDAADEAFCPYDLSQTGSVWDPEYIISDDELNDLFVTLPDSVSLEVFLDTCHSGTGIKSIDFLLTRRPRYLPPPSLEAFKDVEGRTSRGFAGKYVQPLRADHILWTGCKADQTSADAMIGDSWHGAFTYYLCDAIRESGDRFVREEILKKVRDRLLEGEYTQIPQLEWNATNRDESASEPVDS